MVRDDVPPGQADTRSIATPMANAGSPGPPRHPSLLGMSYPRAGTVHATRPRPLRYGRTALRASAGHYRAATPTRRQHRHTLRNPSGRAGVPERRGRTRVIPRTGVLRGPTGRVRWHARTRREGAAGRRPNVARTGLRLPRQDHGCAAPGRGAWKPPARRLARNRAHSPGRSRRGGPAAVARGSRASGSPGAGRTDRADGRTPASAPVSASAPASARLFPPQRHENGGIALPRESGPRAPYRRGPRPLPYRIRMLSGARPRTPGGPCGRHGRGR